VWCVIQSIILLCCAKTVERIDVLFGGNYSWTRGQRLWQGYSRTSILGVSWKRVKGTRQYSCRLPYSDRSGLRHYYFDHSFWSVCNSCFASTLCLRVCRTIFEREARLGYTVHFRHLSPEPSWLLALKSTSQLYAYQGHRSNYRSRSMGSCRWVCFRLYPQSRVGLGGVLGAVPSAAV